jgi:hypothetical protein
VFVRTKPSDEMTKIARQTVEERHKRAEQCKAASGQSGGGGDRKGKRKASVL